MAVEYPAGLQANISQHARICGAFHNLVYSDPKDPQMFNHVRSSFSRHGLLLNDLYSTSTITRFASNTTRSSEISLPSVVE